MHWERCPERKNMRYKGMRILWGARKKFLCWMIVATKIIEIFTHINYGFGLVGFYFCQPNSNKNKVDEDEWARMCACDRNGQINIENCKIERSRSLVFERLHNFIISSNSSHWFVRWGVHASPELCSKIISNAWKDFKFLNEAIDVLAQKLTKKRKLCEIFKMFK